MSTSENPNNCETCDYKQMHGDEGFCYMFADEPDDICMQHTMRKEPTAKELEQRFKMILKT